MRIGFLNNHNVKRKLEPTKTGNSSVIVKISTPYNRGESNHL